MNAELVPANQVDHQELLRSLLHLYMHDLSEYFEISTDRSGWYGYNYDWDNPGNHPFLAFQDSLPVGFALVARGSAITQAKDVWDMNEFFVIRSCRRLGVGLWLAHEMYKNFPGKWEIRIGEKNTGGLAFWRQSLLGLDCNEPTERFLEGTFGFFHCLSTTIT